MISLVKRLSLSVVSLMSLLATSAHATLVVRVTDSAGVQTFQVGKRIAPDALQIQSWPLQPTLIFPLI